MNETAIGGLFLALLYGMSEEGREAARDMLLMFADDPQASEAEVKIYLDMIEATTPIFASFDEREDAVLH